MARGARSNSVSSKPSSLAGRTGLQDLHTGVPFNPIATVIKRVDRPLGDLEPAPAPGDARLGVEGAGTASFPPIGGATLALGGHDHQVAAFAVGATDAGWHFESLGTADALTVALSPPVAEQTVPEVVDFGATIGRPAVPDRLIVIIGLRTGQILDRITRLLGLAGADERHALSGRAAQLDASSEAHGRVRQRELAISGIGEGIGPEQLWRAAVAAADDRTTDVTSRFERWFGEPGAVGAAAMAGIAAGVLDGPFAGAVQTERSAS